jgi:hypothetical protein
MSVAGRKPVTKKHAVRKPALAVKKFTKRKAKRRPATVNRSELIRKYKSQHPQAGPKEISEALAGHKISYGLVTKVLYEAKGKKRDKKMTTEKPTAHSNGHAVDFVRSAFTLGLDKAIGLLQRVKRAVE